MLSTLVLRRFGEAQFPGARTADIAFCPAGKLPEGKSSEELEKEGILAVDVGGGRLDSHPVENQVTKEKQDRCAADLTAEMVGISDDPAWRSLIQYTRLQDTTGQSIRSRDYVHHLGTLPTILSGLQLLYGSDSYRLLHEGMNVLEVITLYLERKEKTDSQNAPDSRLLLKELIGKYLLDRGSVVGSAEPTLVTIRELHRRLIENPEIAFSPDPLDEMVSLPALLAGLMFREEGNQERITGTFNFWLDAIWEREKQWANALEEFDNRGIVHKVRNVSIASVVSTNGMVIKAARFRVHADLIIYRDGFSGATSLLLNRRGPLNKFSMPSLAEKVRIAECIEEKTTPDYQRLRLPGMMHKWFLHPSDSLLICGSPKAKDFIPSKIQMNNLLGIALTEIEWLEKMPIDYCPNDTCTGESCLFYRLHARACKNHRDRHKIPKTGYTLAEKLSVALNAKNKEVRK
ncbi:MAG: hypothetical protein KF749_02880 [Bacteroidetes bacterium]|nr:hypothetical protein [Bacteroidota bacterium]MCW5896761.1 hypothetical protein [Bacteroidota bacterium]